MADEPNQPTSGNMEDTGTERVIPRRQLAAQIDMESASASDAAPLLDPMTMRDTNTNKLKRIQPISSSGVSPESKIAPEEGLNTETVHLKVIKEKKKQLAGILSASQTIRLRPSSNEARETQDQTDHADETVAAPVPQDAKTENMKRPTMKMAPPPMAASIDDTVNLNKGSMPHGMQMDTADSVEDTVNLKRPTLKIAPPPGAGGVQDSGTAFPKAKSTLKIKSPASTASAPPMEIGAAKSTLKIKSPGGSQGIPPAMEGQAKSTLKIKSLGATVSTPAPTEAKSTLKIKVPGSTVSAPVAPVAQPKATLKIKAPGASQTVTPATTDDGVRAKSTLKIKSPMASSPTQTQEALPPPSAAETLIQKELPSKAKTLKLKAGKESARTGSVPAISATTGGPPSRQVDVDAKAIPGIAYTLGAVASLCIAGALIYLHASQLSELFKVF